MSLKYRNRLAALIAENGRGYSFFSKLLGRNSAYIQQYITRGSPNVLSKSDALALASFLDVPVAELGPFTDNKDRSVDLVFVPYFANAEDGSDTDQHWICERRWLAKLSPNPQSMFAFQIRGDAMASALMSGDMVICERWRDKSSLMDGLYIIDVGGRFEARRICLEPKRRLVSVICDNRVYPDWHGMSRKSLHIYGAVRGTIKTTH